MTQRNNLTKRTDEEEEIIRQGNEGEASVKEDLADLQEEQSEIKKNKEKRTMSDSEKSSKQKFDQARQEFSEYEKKAEAYVKENPKKALAMAGAAALIAGSVVSAFRKK